LSHKEEEEEKEEEWYSYCPHQKRRDRVGEQGAGGSEEEREMLFAG